MQFNFSDLPPFKEQGCCDSGCDCATSNLKSSTACPTCNMFGEIVSNLTVYSLSDKERRRQIDQGGDDGYSICLTPSCNTLYYLKKSIISTDQARREFHLKDSSSTHTICYCLKIDRDEIVDAVHNQKLTGMRDIMKTLKGEPPCKCEKNNPTGLCCEDEFNQIIKEAIDSYV